MPAKHDSQRWQGFYFSARCLPAASTKCWRASLSMDGLLAPTPILIHTQQVINLMKTQPMKFRQPMHWLRSELAGRSFCDCSTA